MRVNKVKKCMGLGILLLMTGCGRGVNTEPETRPQEEQQVEENLQAEADSQTEADSQAEADSQPAESYVEDNDFYVQCLQNLYQGNSITYADGYYYYRSQTENYSLCRTKGTGMPIEVVADQVPGSIYIREDKVYFINVSDNRTLYCVGTDGSGCELLLVIPKLCLKFVTDGETFVVFENMEPLTAEELVLDTSLLYMDDIYYLGRTDENAEEYLDVDGDLYYEESFGTKEAGSVYGYFSITLPKFNAKLDSYEQLNQQMEELFKLALEDKDSFFQEMSELNQDNWISWRREHEYSHLYIGEKYISMHYARGGYEGGMRDWKQSMPLIFDRETGLMLHMDNLFTVEESVYMKRLTGAIYKYCEMTGMDYWTEAFDNNVLVKYFGDFRCYLTPDGIVLCYERYEIKPGTGGSPAFEIPYEWFADIFKQ